MVHSSIKLHSIHIKKLSSFISTSLSFSLACEINFRKARTNIRLRLSFMGRSTSPNYKMIFENLQDEVNFMVLCTGVILSSYYGSYISAWVNY